MPLIMPTLISCDESGFTGNKMLDPNQRHFSYASHDLSLSEAEALIREARARFTVQMPELKASKLLQSQKGRSLIQFVLDRMEGRYIATVYEKRLSLACKLFEYIYEPVLQANNMLFYSNNLHRFVGTYLYVQLLNAPIEDLAAEFEQFMRSLDPEDAPTLLGRVGEEADPLIGQIIRFARGYNFIIAQETRTLRETAEQGKWVLDLTISAVASHLMEWGTRHELIEVTCDDSKPLKALKDVLNAMINRPERVELHVFGQSRAITWNMSRPIDFGSSKDHFGLQIADLVAGVAAVLPGVAGQEELRPLAERVMPHLHQDCILPDLELADIGNDEALVNWLVLEELADRADNGADPLEGMEDFYLAVRASLPEIRRDMARPHNPDGSV